MYDYKSKAGNKNPFTLVIDHNTGAGKSFNKK